MNIFKVKCLKSKEKTFNFLSNILTTRLYYSKSTQLIKNEKISLDIRNELFFYFFKTIFVVNKFYLQNQKSFISSFSILKSYWFLDKIIRLKKCLSQFSIENIIKCYNMLYLFILI